MIKNVDKCRFTPQKLYHRCSAFAFLVKRHIMSRELYFMIYITNDSELLRTLINFQNVSQHSQALSVLDKLNQMFINVDKRI